MNLLSVDWDFFFPVYPTDAGLWHLYDWGHRDAGKIFLEALWYSRAAAFKVEGMELPDTTGEELKFWNRFQFNPGTKLYFADSHVEAYNQLVREGIDNVVNFDAHHDGGYEITLNQIMRSQKVDCSSWMVGYHLAGADIRTIYPSWKAWAMTDEPKPAVPMNRRVDGKRGTPTKFPAFDRIFLCRSGGWSPSWLDSKFDQFLKDCPVTEKIDLGLTERKFEEAIFEQHIANSMEIRKTIMQHNEKARAVILQESV